MAGLLGKISASFGRTSPPARDSRASSDTNISTPPAKPSSQEVEETLGLLISTAEIPREHVDGIARKLREILQEPDHRPYDQIVARAAHPCVKEYLPQVFQMLAIQQRQVEAAKAELRGKDLEDFLQNAAKQKDTYYAGIAETFGRGFDVVLKPNLIFDAAGNPIGVRPADISRFPQCNTTLTGRGGKRKKRQTKKKSHKKRKTLRRIRH